MASGPRRPIRFPAICSGVTGLLCVVSSCGASPRRESTVPRCDAIFSGLVDDVAHRRSPWSLGFKSGVTSAFVPYAAFSTSEPGFAGSDGVAWWYTGVANWPCAALNTNSKAISYGDITLQPGQFILHPGEKGEQSIARFTAYRPGQVEVRASFHGVSHAPATTDAHVYCNGQSLAEGGINVGGAGNVFTYLGRQSIAADDTLDFAIGYGNGNYTCDSTALEVSVCALY